MTISAYVALAVLLLLLVWAVAAWIRQASRDAGSAGAPQGRSDSGGRLYEEIEARTLQRSTSLSAYARMINIAPHPIWHLLLTRRDR